MKGAEDDREVAGPRCAGYESLLDAVGDLNDFVLSAGGGDDFNFMERSDGLG